MNQSSLVSETENYLSILTTLAKVMGINSLLFTDKNNLLAQTDIILQNIFFIIRLGLLLLAPTTLINNNFYVPRPYLRP